MLVFTFHAPHAQRPHTDIHAWWTRFDELVAAWKLQFSNIVLLGDTNGRVGSDLFECCWTRRSRRAEQYWPSVASGTPLKCLTVHNEPMLDRLHRQCLDLMEKPNTALTTLRCLRLGNNCRSKPSIILRVTFPWDPLTTLPPPPG